MGDQSEAITKVVVHHTPIDASALETGSGGLIVDMVTRTAPTVLTAKNFNGVIHSSGLGNVSWNQDGQCAFSHRKGVVILTPYITSTLPPPPKLVDPNERLEHAITASNRIKRKAEEVEDADGNDEDEDGDVPSTTVRRMRRPQGGEVQWWRTGFAVNPEGDNDRLDAYAWEDTGDHLSAMIGDKEAFVRKIVWSPSGLSELGGCVLAVFLASGQVSIYAPKSNPASNQWEEIADLTILTKELLAPALKSPALSIRGMLEMRTTSLAWSPAVPLSSEHTDAGSILALGNRAGMVALWVLSPMRRFTRIAYFPVTTGCVSGVAWSPWATTADGVYDCQLAVTSTDGSVHVMAIRQQANPDPDEPWRTIFGDLRQIDAGDERMIVSVQWVNTLLVWSKAGSMHLWTEGGRDGYKWQGVRNIRLQRVGSWAGANALGACVGIQTYGSDSVLITLASLTRHLICSIHTSPQLAPLADSLRLSVSARECFLDETYHDAYKRNRQIATSWPEGKDVSAFVAGVASLNDDWGIDTWTAEPIHYHNLSSSTEGLRSFAFMLVDRSGVLHDDSESLENRLERLLSSPPKVLETSPLRALLPYILRVLSSNDPGSHTRDLQDVCAQDSTITSSSISGSHEEKTALEILVEHLWDDDVLNNLRLRYVLALWAGRQFSSQALQFEQLGRDLAMRIEKLVRMAILHWVSSAVANLGSTSEPASSKSQALLRSLADQTSSDASDETETSQLNAPARAGDVDPALAKDYCPACRSEVKSTSLGVAKCSKGHEWVRCCATNMLITTSKYRACSICPAVALLANRFKEPLRPVLSTGRDVDWERFNHTRDEGDLTEKLLEVAKVCLMCGGRWVKSM